ncbi:MAG: peptidase [Odoribacter sp.]|nr:peptidase [Odoribacter sp.]
MKRAFIFIFFFLFTFSLYAEGYLWEKLQNIPEISDIEKINVSPFEEYYLCWFEQPIDHDNPGKGTFKQKVYIGHTKQNAPVIVELEGYEMGSPVAGELTERLKGNQLKIEHRFFDKSVPAGVNIPWEYLTIQQAATDQHKIIETIKREIYPDSKFITTGISKGGQAVIFHRYFYPEDVNASVAYVAPLNLKQVDPRIEKFLNKQGKSKEKFGSTFFSAKASSSEACFWDIRDFQLTCFKNIESILPLFEEYTKEHDYTFELVGGSKRALELTILEYQFAFWQWGNNCSDIPMEDEGLEILCEHLIKVSPPSFFEDSHIQQLQPFFYSALTEIGMYDYNIKPFKKYLDDKANIGFMFAFPKDAELKPFNEKQMADINLWLQTTASSMLFIYGGIDPWSATAVDLKVNPACNIYIKGDMHHGCRISSFEAITQQDIMDTLKYWLR